MMYLQYLTCTFRIRSLESELDRLRAQLGTLSRETEAARAEARSAETAAAHARDELATEREHQHDYKVKAKLVLAEKEKLIAALRNPAGATTARRNSAHEELLHQAQ